MALDVEVEVAGAKGRIGGMSDMTCSTGLRWSMGSCAAVLLMLSLYETGSVLATTYREETDATHKTCTHPGDLGSFKGQPVPHIAISPMILLYRAFERAYT